MKKLMIPLVMLAAGPAQAAYGPENYIADCDKGVALAIITLVERDTSVKLENLVAVKREVAESCGTTPAEEIARVTARPMPATFATRAGMELVGNAARIPAENREAFLAAATRTMAMRGDLDGAAQERHLAWIERERNEGEAFQRELDSPRHHSPDSAVRMRNRGVQMCLFGALSSLELLGQSSDLSTNQRYQLLRQCGTGFDKAPIPPDEKFENVACKRGAENVLTLYKSKLSRAQEKALDADCHELTKTSEVIDLEELLH